MTTLTEQFLRSEQKRRKDGASSAKLAQVLAYLSDKQRNFVTDPARFKVAVCPRRAGKSVSLCAYMVIECLKAPQTPVLYLGLTRDAAKAAVWDELLRILDRNDIQYEARPSALSVRLSNGSTIQLFGGDTPNARHRLRGRKFKLIAVDEAGFVNNSHFDELIYALTPSLADLKGTMAMASSPGEVMDGFFYHAYEGDMKQYWSQHHWDMLDNPLFMKPSKDSRYKSVGEEELHTICNLQFGGNWEHPAFQREWRGVYRVDKERLVYPYDTINLIDENSELPQEMYGIGIDLGVTSESAIVVGKFSEYSRQFEFVECWEQKNASVDELAAEIISRQEKYKPIITVADTGGLGAATVQELRRRYSMAITAAEKRDKTFFQRIFANDLISGYIKVPKHLTIIKEWDIILRDVSGEEIKGVKNHCADAGLYLYRYAYSAFYKHVKPIETPETIMIRQLVESAMKEKEDEEDGY